MKKLLTKLKPFVPALIMLVIILISLFLVLSFDIETRDNISHKDPAQIYKENETARNNMLIFSVVIDVIVMSFYLLEIKFRKTILKWILFNASFILMIASCFILGMSLNPTTCHNLIIMISIPILNFILFIVSFVFACIFLKQQKKLDL